MVVVQTGWFQFKAVSDATNCKYRNMHIRLDIISKINTSQYQCHTGEIP